MKYLLDTHTFLWWIADSPKISQGARDVIVDTRNEIFLSTASIWEMMIKSKLKKLDLPDNPREFIIEQLFLNSKNILNITVDHTFEIYSLPEIHKDPFDRMLVAQAKVESFSIVTADPLVKQYDVNTYW